MYLFIDKVMHARTKASEKSSIANENLRIHVSDNGISGRIFFKKIYKLLSFTFIIFITKWFSFS